MSKPSKSAKAPRKSRTKKARPGRLKTGTTRRTATPSKADNSARPGTKQAILIKHLRRPGGATIADLVKATGWQAHSVRGAISGTLKKKLGLAIASEAVAGRGRVYRIAKRG